MARFHAKLNKRRWAAVRRSILQRDGYRCTQCGKAGRLEVDHIQAVHQGGDPWDERNLQTLCRADHIEKGRREAKVRRRDPSRDAWDLLVQELADGYTSVH